MSLSLYIYIYIYISRERDIHIEISCMCMCVYIYIYIYMPPERIDKYQSRVLTNLNISRWSVEVSSTSLRLMYIEIETLESQLRRSQVRT